MLSSSKVHLFLLSIIIFTFCYVCGDIYFISSKNVSFSEKTFEIITRSNANYILWNKIEIIDRNALLLCDCVHILYNHWSKMLKLLSTKNCRCFCSRNSIRSYKHVTLFKIHTFNNSFKLWANLIFTICVIWRLFEPRYELMGVIKWMITWPQALHRKTMQNFLYFRMFFYSVYIN